MDIKPIETQYAGCRFRSRLEARWAVFFDTLGIEWEYEPQGFEAGDVRYLPDFWLPEMLLFVEVKGVLSHPDFLKIMSAVPKLLEPVDRQIQPVLLLLGPVPRPGLAWLHTRLDMFVGRILWQRAFFEDDVGWWCSRTFDHPASCGPRMAEGFNEEDTAWLREAFLRPDAPSRLTASPAVNAAYGAARSARFEFGQSG